MHKAPFDLRLETVWLQVFMILSIEKSNIFFPYVGVELEDLPHLRQIAQEYIVWAQDQEISLAPLWWRAMKRIIRECGVQVARNIYKLSYMYNRNYKQEAWMINEWVLYLARTARRHKDNKLLRLSRPKKKALKTAFNNWMETHDQIISLARSAREFPSSEWERFLKQEVYLGGDPLTLTVLQCHFYNDITFWLTISEFLSKDDRLNLENWTANIFMREKSMSQVNYIDFSFRHFEPICVDESNFLQYLAKS